MTNGVPPANTWTPIAGCTGGPTDPSIAYSILITGVPATIGAINNGLYSWSITLSDGGSPANFSIDRYDPTGVLIDHPIAISGGDGSVLLTRDPTDPLGAATKQYVDSLPGGVEEAPNDGTSYVRNDLAWVPFGGPYLPLSGGVITGPVTLPANNSVLINGPPGSQRSIVGQTAGITRWQMILGDGTADLTGSNFQLWNANNAGAMSTPCFAINRLSGVATFSAMISIPGGSSGQVLTTNGVGGLSWTTPSGGSGGIPEAPTDGQLYGRQSAAWTVVPSGGGGGIPDAPNDASGYFRKSAAWTHVFSADIVDLTTTLGPYALSSSVPVASTTPPSMDGIVNTGSASTWARADHIHPSDTSRYAASNPSGYQTAAQVTAALAPYALTSSLPGASNALPLIDGTAAAGTSVAYARADHVHPAPAISGGDTLDIAYFGDGSDFAANITTTVLLTRDMYYSNLTISGAGVLVTAGWRVFVSGTLDISAAGAGAIFPTSAAPVAGTDGGAPTAGAASPARGGAFFTGSAPTAGGAGGSTANANGGSSGGVTGALNTGLGGNGGVGGPGGAPSSGTGAPGNPGVLSNPNSGRLRHAVIFLTYSIPTVSTYTGGIGGTGGGGGGNNAATNPCGGGGGGGGAGGCLFIWARTIFRGVSTAAGVLNVSGYNGGNGGNGASVGLSGGGGGGGGGGGFLYLVYRFLTGSTALNAINVSGGNGGNAGTAVSGTAQRGQGGVGGSAGNVVMCNIAADTLTAIAGAAGGLPTGTGSVTGGLGAPGLVNL